MSKIALNDRYLDRIADALEKQMQVGPKLIGGNVLKPNIDRIADALDPNPVLLKDGTVKNPLARIADSIEKGLPEPSEGGGGPIPDANSVTKIVGYNKPEATFGSDGDTYLQLVFHTGVLTSSDLAYINTGIKPMSRYRVDFTASGMASSEYDTIYGCRKSSTQRFTARFISGPNGSLDFHISETKNAAYNETTFYAITKNVFASGFHRIEVKSGYVSLDRLYGTNNSNLSISDDAINDVPFDLDLFLFANNDNGAPGDIIQTMSLRIFILYDYDERLICFLIPAKDEENTPCLYDVIRDTYLYNANSVGQFTYTDEDKELYFIKWVKEEGVWIPKLFKG